MSFIVFCSKKAEYVEIDGAIATGKDKCYIAFKYVDDLRVKSNGRMPSMPDDWCAMTDFALTVRAIPVANSLAQIESLDGVPKQASFKMLSKEHVSLSGGDLYIASYVAIKPTERMISENENREMIFVTGNDARSIVFFLYSEGRTIRLSKMLVAA